MIILSPKLLNYVIVFKQRGETIVFITCYAPVNANPVPPPTPHLADPRNSDWEKVSVRIHTLPLAFNVRITTQKIYISTTCNVIISEWCWKELLLSESPVWSNRLLSYAGGIRIHFDRCIIGLYSVYTYCKGLVTWCLQSVKWPTMEASGYFHFSHRINKKNLTFWLPHHNLAGS